MEPSHPTSSDKSGSTIPRSTNWKRNLFGVVITIACLGFIASRIDLAGIRNAIAYFQWPYLFAGLGSLFIGYSMRIIRWSVMLRAAGAKISVTDCAAPFMGSIALNNVLPMRLGDVVRALLFPSAIGVDKTTAMGSLVMERLVDLMTLLVCLVVGLTMSGKAQLPDWLTDSVVTLALVGGGGLLLVFLFSGKLSGWLLHLSANSTKENQQIIKKILTALGNLLNSFSGMSRLPVLATLFGLSIFVWAGEAGLFWSFLLGFGLQAGPETAVIVMAIATLSTLVPSSPGYVGPFHLAAYAAIAMLGGTSSQAASFAVLSHLGVWLPTTLAGAFALLVNPQLFSGAKAKAQAH